MPARLKLTTEPTEKQFTAMVLDLAKLHGWRRLHIRPARTGEGWRTPIQGDGAGWPDLLLIRGAELVVAELKVGHNATTDAQEAWLAAFEGVPGVRVFVWFPKQWDEIEAVLSARPKGGRR